MTATRVIVRLKLKMVKCACGCGGLLPKVRYKGHLRLIYNDYPRYLLGHTPKGK